MARAAEVVYSVRLARETSESETVRDEDRAEREVIQARGRRERERRRKHTVFLNNCFSRALGSGFS
jgi:hypothetical protein